MLLSNTYLWLVTRENFVPVHESPFRAIYVLIHLTWGSWPSQLGALSNCRRKGDKDQWRDGPGSSCRILGPILFLHQTWRQLNPQGFQVEENCVCVWCGIFFFFFLFSLSLKQAFLSTSHEPEKSEKSLFQTHQYTVFLKWNMLPRCCSFSEKLMILSVLPLVAAARVSGFVAGLEPVLLWLAQSALHQTPVHLGCWSGPQLQPLVSQDRQLWGNLQLGSSPGLGQQPVRLFETSDSKGSKSHPMAMTWRWRLSCPWVMCFMPCPRAGASRNPISLTLTQPISWVIPKSGTAHWLQPPNSGRFPLFWDHGVSITSSSFVSVMGCWFKDVFDKMWRSPSGVITASWLLCGSWFTWGRMRQTRTLWWSENVWLELVRKCFDFLLQNLRKVINTSNFYAHKRTFPGK